MEQIKEAARQKSLLWSAKDNIEFKNFMNDEILSKEKVSLQNRGGDTSANLVYQAYSGIHFK